MESLSLRNSPWRVQVAWFISFTQACIIRGVHSFGRLCLNLLQIVTLCVQSGTVTLYVAHAVFCNVLKMLRAVFWACQTHHNSQRWVQDIFCTSYFPKALRLLRLMVIASLSCEVIQRQHTWQPRPPADTQLSLPHTSGWLLQMNAEGMQTKYV